MTLRVRVQPRAARDGIAGVRDGVLQVRLTAPPVEGAANDALVKLLGRTLGIAPSRIEVMRGARGREKLLRIDGAGPEIAARLAAASEGKP